MSNARKISSTVMQWLGAAAMAASLAGCPCPGGDVPLASWNFESDCTDSLCGFMTVSGTATRVQAFQAGEHAMQLASGTEVSQSLSQPLLGGDAGFVSSGTRQGESVTFIGRCDAGTTLLFEELVSENLRVSSDGGTRSDASADSGAGSVNTVPHIRLGTVTVSPGTDWSQLNGVFASPDAAPVGSVVSATLVNLRITVQGPGTCTIDSIGVHNLSQPGYGYCE